MIFFRLNIAGILNTSDPFLAYQAYEELYINSEGYCKQQALKNLVRLSPEESLKWYLSAMQTDDWMTANLAMDSLVSTRYFTPGRIIPALSPGPTLLNWYDGGSSMYWATDRNMNYLDLHLEALSDPGWLVHNEAALALSRMPQDLVLPELRYLEQSGDPATC